MAGEPEAEKREIEARYAALCARVDEAAGSAQEDDALRDAFAELAAMMIAYSHETGAKQALVEALSRAEKGRTNPARLSLAARALKRIAEDNGN
ncbi:hypothetical protein [Martelella mangrovi]|uniref:Uncharacterized protein n=1 Tax=Martelella mangrovi TaxID=1397477 RepID=A0ABV2I9F4_9HYPH